MFILTNRRYLALFLIVFVNFLGGTIVLPTIPLYAQRQFQAEPEQISLLLASYFAAQFLAAPFLGRLSDRYGRLPVLIYSQIGTVLSFVLMAAAQDISLLFLARILDGVTGGNVIVAQAYVTDITPREKRTQGLGIIFMAFGLGYVMGPALGGLIASVAGDHTPFIVGAAVTLVTVIMTVLMLDESLPKEKRMLRQAEGTARMKPAEVLANRPLQIILLIGFCAQFSIALLQGTIALYAAAELFRGVNENSVNLGVGLLLTSIGIGQLITQIFFIRPAIRHVGERRLVVFGAIFRGLGMLSIVFFASPWLVGAVSMLMISVSSGLMMPSLQTLATTTVREEISGGVLGVYNAATSLGLIVGTVIGGTLFDTAHTLPFWVAGLTLMATAIPAIFLMRRSEAVVPPQPVAAPRHT